MGYFMYNMKTHDFDFKDGMAMCNLLLADEINRTSPRTQSALLQVMEEGKVTVDSVTKELPKPFFVIATQNPFGSFGTQRMPQSQLDRFLIRLSMGYPDKESEIEIMKGAVRDKIGAISQITDKKGILQMQDECASVYVDDSIYDYIASISYETRNSPYLSVGISPRGTLAILKMSRANAYFNDRDYVIPQDIIEILVPVTAHRIELSAEASAQDLNEEQVIEMIRKSIKMPKVRK
jgi:MoxR-like ATPase